MYTKSKYVIGMMRLDHSIEMVAVIIPENVPHVSVAQLFQERSIVGAGFCHSDDDDVKVYGNSASLRVGTRHDEDKPYVGRSMSHPKYSSDY